MGKLYPVEQVEDATGFYPKPPHGWTCFHCGELFTTQGAARNHFGFDPSSDPACRIKVGAERGLVMALRKAEAELYEYTNLLHDESLEAYRLLARARSQHGDQIQTAEELGYERGLADGRIEATPAVDREGVGLAKKIAEVMAEGDGHWSPCTGCQESSEGCVSTDLYPYDPAFKCQPGGGCGECGGIGATWTPSGFYDGIIEFSQEQDRTHANVLAELKKLVVINGQIFGLAAAADAIMALHPVKQSDDAAALQRAQDRYANLAIGLEEIRDACWPGDDAVDRIRRCAARWLSGEEEDLDARMRADLAQERALNPVVKQSDGLAERVKEACAVVADDDAAQAPQANGAKQGSVAASYHAGWEHAGRRIASAIRSLDITRMGGSD